MKKLQNNFTTPEQSKRLLDLGVPADSADLYYDKYRILPILLFNGDVCQDVLNAFNPENFDNYLPCWSAGRLIEIFAKCKMYGEENKMIPLELYADEINSGLVDFLIDVMYNYNDLDFSKLEE